MKTYFVKGLKISAFTVLGIGYAMAVYYGGLALGYTLGKKLLV